MGSVQLASNRPFRFAVGALALLMTGAVAQDAGTQIPALNLKVVKFAESNKGKQVGNGECWTLAADALTSAGAQRPGADGFEIFDFGRKLTEKEAALPGDIVQFTDAKFTRKDPAGKNPPIVTGFPQHTGVVTKVDAKVVTMLHQNYGGKKTVESYTFNLSELTGGTAEFFRPRAKKVEKAEK